LLDARHLATCTASVSATDNGLWQLDLVARWWDPKAGGTGECVWMDTSGAIVDQAAIP
jgi:hypothetical protein